MEILRFNRRVAPELIDHTDLRTRFSILVSKSLTFVENLQNLYVSCVVSRFIEHRTRTSVASARGDSTWRRFVQRGNQTRLVLRWVKVIPLVAESGINATHRRDWLPNVGRNMQMSRDRLAPRRNEEENGTRRLSPLSFSLLPSRSRSRSRVSRLASLWPQHPPASSVLFGVHERRGRNGR